MARERKNKYGTERGPGAGRPPGDPVETKVHALFVDGRVRTYPDDGETAEKIGRLRAAAEPFGMVVHCVPIEGGDIEMVRRSWGTGKIDHTVAEAYIRDYPGVTFQRWVEEVWMGGDPINELTLGAARAKARVALSIMFRRGRVRKQKDVRGRLCLYPAKNAAATGDMPADVKIDVDKCVKAALSRAHVQGKQVSVAAVAVEVAEVVWHRFVESFAGERDDAEKA